MIRTSKDELVRRQKSDIIVTFLEYYNNLEVNIKNIFAKEVEACKQSTIKNKLYFFLGSKLSAYYDYKEDHIAMQKKNFKTDETFMDLSLKQMIGFHKENNIIKELDSTFTSKQTPKTSYSVGNSIEKLIAMRNKIAHEILTSSYKDKELIEKLSKEHLEKNPLKNLTYIDYELLDDASIEIYSNCVYIEDIIEIISNKKEVK